MKMRLKEPVPKRTEKPIMNLVTDKNFITANAIETILAKPKTRKAEGPDEFLYTQKATFGKVPAYLSRNKARIESEKQQVQEYLRLKEQQVCLLPPSSVQKFFSGTAGGGRGVWGAELEAESWLASLGRKDYVVWKALDYS